MLGKKIKNLLMENNIKQQDLAAYLNISPSRLSNYISDKREIDFQTLSEIALFFKVDLNYFSDKFSNLSKNVSSYNTLSYNTSSNFNVNDIVNISHVNLNGKIKAVNKDKIAVSKIFFNKLLDDNINNNLSNSYIENNGVIFACTKETATSFIFESRNYSLKEYDLILGIKIDISDLKNGDIFIIRDKKSVIYKAIKTEESLLFLNLISNSNILNINEIPKHKEIYKVLWICNNFN